MNIVVAIDSFKGSLSSYEANSAVAQSLKELGHTAYCFNVADGGEGTVDALCNEKTEIWVTGPLTEKVKAQYGVLNDTAVIETASAAGLTLVPENLRNPLNTTTYGVGEIIRDAIEKGIHKFFIGIGGSATNDGGFGMLCALGCKFFDKNGKEIPLGARGLEYLHRADISCLMPEIRDCEFLIACDVSNPLCGKNGCSAVFAPQKGASDKDVEVMDKWLESYAKILGQNKDIPGAGAAGGLGFAFAFLGGKLLNGAKTVLEKIGIEEYIKNADMVITGEGKTDSQTGYGKMPFAIAKLSQKYGKRVIAFCGKKETDNIEGIDEIFEITPCNMHLAEAMEKAYEYLKKSAYDVLKGL